MTSIDTGQFLFRLLEAPEPVWAPLRHMYGVQCNEADDRPADFRIALRFDSMLRRYFRPQITFYSDRQAPFKPVPLSQVFPILEWGMNWCIAAFDYNRFIVHAAVLVKQGKALIFPAQPGSGKSTLTAYLALSGWTLYSDEMAFIDFGSCRVSPIYRPVCLKNESIDLVKSWFPDAVMTETSVDTQKGDVAHLKVLDWSTWNTLGDADIVGVVFPRYQRGSDLIIYSMDKMQGFSEICSNSFNYNIVGKNGFETVARVVENTRQIEVHYSDVAAVNEFLLEEFVDV